MAPALGIPSEAWLYRQATMIDQLEVHVLCYRHQNPLDYPAGPCRMIELYPSRGLVSRGLRRLRRAIKKRVLSPENFFLNDFDVSIWNRAMATRFDTCLVHYGTMATKFADRLVNSNIPYAIHFNGFDLSEKVLDSEYVRKLRPALESASALIVVAHYMRDWLIHQGVEPAKIKYLPYGVPLDQFQPAPKHPESCQFLMVGRLTPKKAPTATLRAFAKCHAQCPDTRLRIIGDGSLLAECQQLVDKLKLGPAVEFLGAQPGGVVQKELAAADVFVQHSITPESGDREGWPVAIAEAAASGLPVISTRHASIPEQVVEGETGFLVEEHDWESMSDYMVELARDPAKRVAMGAQARKHISNWSTQDQVRKLETILLSTIQNGCQAKAGDH